MEIKILEAVFSAPKGTWYFVSKAGKAISQARTMRHKHRFDCKMEDIIAVMDCTVFGSGKDGFLLTEKGMYNARDKKHPFVAFSEIVKAEVQKQYYVKLFFKNGETLDWYCLSSDSYIADVLNRIIKELSQNVVEQKKPAEKKESKKESVKIEEAIEKAKARQEAEEKARREAEEKARKEAEEEDPFALELSPEMQLESEQLWEELGMDSNNEEKANENADERNWEKTLATAERLMKEYIESTDRPKTIQQLKEDGLKALNNLDYKKAQSCFKRANEKTLYAIAVCNDSKATLELLMEAEFMACEEAAKTNDSKANEVLGKLRRRLAGVLINREEERTVDYAGVDLPTRYLALRYALMQNDREAISTAAYNLAILYFRRYDNAYMCGVEEAAALCFMAQEQDRLMGNSTYSRAHEVLRDCDSAMEYDYRNPPNAGKYNERIARLDRLADDQPFAAYGRAKYYCRCGKKKEDLWRAEKLAVYAVSAEYKPLKKCFYSATAHKVVCVDVEQQSPEELLQEIRDKLKAKGWPSKYDMTDRWKEHHTLLKKLEKAEKTNQKDSYGEAWDAYYYAGENMEKLEKAKAMAEALLRVNVKGSIMDRNSQRLLKRIEAKITYVKGKQYLEEGKYGMASRELDSLKGDDRTQDAMYHLARAYLCADSAFDIEVFHSNTKYAIISSGNEELKELLKVLEYYTEGRGLERRKDGQAEYRYRDAVNLVSDKSPYPHPFYWYAKYCKEESYSVYSREYNEQKLKIAFDSCKKGMEMIDKTSWLTKEARESLHSSFESLYKDIQSEYRIMNSRKKSK